MANAGYLLVLRASSAAEAAQIASDPALSKYVLQHDDKLSVTSLARLVLPRLSTTERDGLSPAPATGTVIHNTTTDTVQAFTLGGWVDLH